MTTVVIPFRSGGKTRLPAAIRTELSLAMLCDVITAAASSGRVRVVTDDRVAAGLAVELRAEAIDDPGGGQGAAVATALVGLERSCLVVNADLPCVTPEALSRLAATSPSLVAAADGTTNALSLAEPAQFAPLYGSGSAGRFAAAGFHAVSIPELEQDVDTLADLERLTLPVGARTALVLDQHRLRLVPAS
jgi:2-phospho-L-lactate guanylyltransferase